MDRVRRRRSLRGPLVTFAVLWGVFGVGAVGLMAAITYSLTFAVADQWRRARFGRSTTGVALTVHRYSIS